ncbi:hypothetical protein [Chamaesiphon minutus]|uniref:Uncharacterized protein n=1 Tax=Chamaesiphon minutus (strain ATCC 27169 / PCC 6605) TaxID=1173020 RepID=K9UIR3_CHAP6|nr:hypothetical protein [Chamaesiphon minutus]AFY94311.1 hypothetical protein Cha6605_3307 [Chamaesiphon minutus PCC 6605]
MNATLKAAIGGLSVIGICTMSLSAQAVSLVNGICDKLRFSIECQHPYIAWLLVRSHYISKNSIDSANVFDL